jgi:signal transduction histidine kinase
MVILLLLPQVGAGGSISGCRALCPENVLAVTSDSGLALDLWEVFRYAVIGVAIATAALLVWRLVTGTPPQRRAMALGASLALVFLVLQVAYHLLALIAPDATSLGVAVAWAFAAARAAMWYGFLAALIGAQLFAARALQRLVAQSLHRPSQPELEAMLREPLGDPQLRLAFWNEHTQAWTTAAGETLEAPARDSGLHLSVIEQRGVPAAALLHDAHLTDDPELLQAAGAVALLAAENAALDAGWSDALAELQRSRARIIRAGDSERRRLERNIHDGVQQQLVAVRIDIGLTADLASTDSELRDSLAEIGRGVEDALDELREIVQGLYPPVLSDWGLVPALERVRTPATVSFTVDGEGVDRHAPELELAVYYCCVEAIQNAIKHGGPAATISVTLRQHPDELSFQVTDSGRGFDPSQPHGGTGLQSMRDRLGALNGRLSLIASPGGGTTVAGSVPLRADQTYDGDAERSAQTA